MIHICLFDQYSTASKYGIGKYISEYISCMDSINIKITLVRLGSDENINEIRISNNKSLTTITIPFIYTPEYTIYHNGVCRIIRMYITDSKDLIFHFNYMDNDSLFYAIRKYYTTARYICTVHYLHWTEYLWGNNHLYHDIIKNRNLLINKKKHKEIINYYNKERKFLNALDAVICLSKDTYNLLENLYKVKCDKLHLILNGLEEKRLVVTKTALEIKRELNINNDKAILLFVGRVNVNKGIYPLLHSIKKLITNINNIHLVIIGDGGINEVVKHCKDMCTNISFIGRQNQDELYRWYRVADIAIFPSYFEECSFVGIEMMMHGLPIVASDGYGVKNMFNGQNAVIATIKDPYGNYTFEENLAKKISLLLNNPEIAEMKKRQARETFLHKYTSISMQEGYERLFRKIIPDTESKTNHT
jgi:glycosyltransferase